MATSSKRAQELPPGIWKWIPAIITSPVEDIASYHFLAILTSTYPFCI